MSRFNGQLSESNGLKDTKCPLSEDTTLARGYPSKH